MGGRVGHKQKTANRAAGIARNEARIKKLAQKIGEIGEGASEWRKELKDEIEVLAEELDESLDKIHARLDLLERSLWRKMMDRIKKVRKGNPTKAPNRAVIVKDGDVRKEAHERAGKETKKKKKGKK
jgi:hypothetical protein